MMLSWNQIQHLQPFNEQQLSATACYTSHGSSSMGASHRETVEIYPGYETGDSAEAPARKGNGSACIYRGLSPF